MVLDTLHLTLRQRDGQGPLEGLFSLLTHESRKGKWEIIQRGEIRIPELPLQTWVLFSTHAVTFTCLPLTAVPLPGAVGLEFRRLLESNRNSGEVGRMFDWVTFSKSNIGVGHHFEEKCSEAFKGFSLNGTDSCFFLRSGFPGGWLLLLGSKHLMIIAYVPSTVLGAGSSPASHKTLLHRNPSSHFIDVETEAQGS